MTRRGRITLAASAALVLIGSVVWLARSRAGAQPTAARAATTIPSPVASSTHAASPSTAGELMPQAVCDRLLHDTFEEGGRDREFECTQYELDGDYELVDNPDAPDSSDELDVVMKFDIEPDKPKPEAREVSIQVSRPADPESVVLAERQLWVREPVELEPDSPPFRAVVLGAIGMAPESKITIRLLSASTTRRCANPKDPREWYKYVQNWTSAEYEGVIRHEGRYIEFTHHTGTQAESRCNWRPSQP